MWAPGCRGTELGAGAAPGCVRVQSHGARSGGNPGTVSGQGAGSRSSPGAMSGHGAGTVPGLCQGTEQEQPRAVSRLCQGPEQEREQPRAGLAAPVLGASCPAGSAARGAGSPGNKARGARAEKQRWDLRAEAFDQRMGRCTELQGKALSSGFPGANPPGHPNT